MQELEVIRAGLVPIYPKIKDHRPLCASPISLITWIRFSSSEIRDVKDNIAQ